MYPSQWFLVSNLLSRVKSLGLMLCVCMCCPIPLQHNPGGGITYKGFDLNVEPAWKMGFTGKNVVVTILDDGEFG